MARVSACLFSCKPAHRVKLCDRPKRLRQDLPARKVCPICNGSPFPKKKKEKGIQNRTDLPRRARPISSGPPFPNPKIGKRGPFKIGQARQLPPFLMTSKFKHSTVQICQGPQYSKESQSVEQQKTAIKIKKIKTIMNLTKFLDFVNYVFSLWEPLQDRYHSLRSVLSTEFLMPHCDQLSGLCF